MGFFEKIKQGLKEIWIILEGVLKQLDLYLIPSTISLELNQEDPLSIVAAAWLLIGFWDFANKTPS